MKPSLLLGAETHQDLLQLLLARRNLTVSGAANETAKALLVGRLFELSPRAMILVTRDKRSREAVARWCAFFDIPVGTLALPAEEELTLGHLALLLSFVVSGEPRLLLLEKDEWERPLPSFADLEKRKVTLTRGERIDLTDLFERLLNSGYHHTEDPHLLPGEYRKVGDTLAVFPLQSRRPVAVRFSFEEVEEIRSPHSGETHDAVDIYPASWEEETRLLAQLPQGSLLILDEVEEDERRTVASVPALTFTAFPQTEENHLHVRYLSVLKFYTLPDFLNDIRDKLEQQWALLVVTKRAEELRGILTEERLPTTEDGSCERGKITILDASSVDVLPHSLQNPDLRCAMLTDREIFTLRRESRQRSIQKLALDFITSLQPGDFVVHMDHGIGRFAGITRKTVDRITREYLELQYAGTDKLFIPIDQADKLSKFVHEEGEEPVLSRLGSVEWKRTTEKVREETKRVAKELLDLYAKRARATGHAFPPDSECQRRFEEAFPYAETPGQIKAMQDIKGDMESGHPMDRLVCGDVGFGKTEVALRAAFKAMQAGKQVAFISPITILADQHYHTLQKRMEGFPVRAEMLSRFRTPKEQKEILGRLRKGDLDIAVGTHRLLQDDVKFFNLGLVIIDEEQRFGVKQKEKLKALRASVDILTLTATPIPRTLNLSLHKLRDITTITTPPPGRLPIITEVRRYSDALIRQAILAEIRRDGQVYMLHNRVETIDAFAGKLRSLVPEASFVVSHGQLKAEDLESRILEFKEGKHSVLVSSTIIENGIDLPRANTLIVDEAEHFGLSQLYQLRGRVGRGKVQAFAYFLYHSRKLSDDAKKRLRAIVEASELGSGFQIAMRDLEIRGAGEILGANQSGHMKTVGVSHFLRLLKQAVEELKAGAAPQELEEITTEINLPIEAYIPPFHIPEEDEKISMYQKLAGCEEEELLKEFERDLREEYGEPPPQVQNLFRVLRLKMASRRAGILRIKGEEGESGRDVILTLAPRVEAEHIIPLLAKVPQWRVSGSSLRIAEHHLGEDWLRGLQRSVELIAARKSAKKPD